MLKLLSNLGLNFGNSENKNNNFQPNLLNTLGLQAFASGSNVGSFGTPQQYSQMNSSQIGNSTGNLTGNLITKGLEANHFNKLSKNTGQSVLDLKGDDKNSFLFGAKSSDVLGKWNTAGNIMGATSSLGKGLGLLKDRSPKTKTQGTLDGIYDGLSNIPGPAGAIMKGAGLATDIMRTVGFHTDNMTRTDKILGSKFFTLTPAGIANTAFGKKSHTYNETAENKLNMANVEPSYSGFDDERQKALSKSGKKYGLFSRGSRKRANRMIDETNRQKNVMSKIGEEAEVDFLSSSNPYLAMSNSFMQQGGWDYKGMRAAKQGMKFKESINKARKILPKLQNAQLRSFKKGGSMNVIPTGKLHAHLNHMSKNDLDVTRKGIPVVSISKGGELIQHAEIEKEEIIMRLEITEKLEKLAALGTDEAAIEAGKILVYEILENTDDKAELMNKINI